MQEKDMVSDILSGTKASLATYAKVIAECDNTTLRQTFQEMRDGDEKFQYNLYKLAASKGYYHPSPPANKTQISGLKNMLSKPAPAMG